MSVSQPRPGAFLGSIVTNPAVTAWEIALDEGTRTMVRAQPAGSARGTVLMIPGFTGSREDGRDLLPALAELGWDAWAYSQRGQADSTHTPGHYRREDFAADAVAVSRALADFTGSTPHLVGHSFGGVVATAAAILDPASFLDVILLCSGPHGWEGRTSQFAQALDAYPGVDNWTLQLQGAVPEVLTAVDEFKRLRAELTDNSGLRAMLEILESTEDFTDQLRATGLASAVIHGADDDAWPIPMQADWATRLGAHYVVIPGAGHLPNTEQPEVTAREFDAWWRGLGTED